MSYNILIVDDSKVVRGIIRKTLHMALDNLGNVYEAGDGEEALEFLDSHWIDLVLADINMPRMNGVELVDEMVARGILESTPVIVISTERSTTRIEELKAKGISAYLNKPFTPEYIKQIVDSLLGVPVGGGDLQQ